MSPYAITKFAGEHYLNIYSKLFGFSWIGLRYGNVYGPRQIRDGECGVIPLFVNNVLVGKKSILMTYDDMPRGCTRDYVYVGDVVDFNEVVTYSTIGWNDIYNVASGIEIPILDIYGKIEKVFDSKVGITIKGPRLGDVKRSVLSIEKPIMFLTGVLK